MIFLSNTYWYVKQSGKKGLGIFARKKIYTGTILGDYLGTLIRTADYDVATDAKGLYLMYFSDTASIYPDRTIPGLHLVNHSCRPNSWMYIYRRHTLFFALRTIFPGEEITISYLLSPRDETCTPCAHDCFCREINCTGTMHLSNEKYKLWQEFQKKNINTMRSPRIVLNAPLARLPRYPERIPILPIYKKIYS